MKPSWSSILVIVTLFGCAPPPESLPPGTRTVGPSQQVVAPVVPIGVTSSDTGSPAPNLPAASPVLPASPAQTIPAATVSATTIVQSDATDAPRYGEKVDPVPNVPIVSYEAYQRVANGMSYEAVCVIFGRRGKNTVWSRVGDTSTAAYEWSNPDHSWADIWFRNNQVTNKINVNLR